MKGEDGAEGSLPMDCETSPQEEKTWVIFEECDTENIFN